MQTIDRDRDRKSLQDLAQMAKGMTPAPSSVAAFGPVPSSRSVTNLGQKDDSGIVDLAAASAADPHAAMRAQTTPLASQSLFDDAPPPPPVHAAPVSQSYIPAPTSQSYIPAPTSQSYIPAPPPVNPPPSGAYAYQQPAPSVPPPPVASVPPQAYASVAPLAPSLVEEKKKSGGLVIAIGGLLAISAAAAGGFLYLGKGGSAPVAHSAGSAPVAHTAEVAPAANDAPKAEAKPAEVAVADKPAEGAMDLNALPNAVSTKTTVTKSGHHATASSKHAAKEPAAPEAKEPAEDPAQAKAEKAKLDKMLAGAAGSEPAPSGPPGDLGAALRERSGGGIMQEQKPAAGSSNAGGGNIPQKPSQGAVTGALGAVLPAARECLGPDDPISKASVVFNADGSVAGVTVSGSAAGKPAATCIEKELKKAKVQPFAEPTYTANITIRHN